MTHTGRLAGISYGMLLSRKGIARQSLRGWNQAGRFLRINGGSNEPGQQGFYQETPDLIEG
jgi:hypothetical protein